NQSAGVRQTAARGRDDRPARDVWSRGCRVDQDVIEQAIIEHPVPAADDGLAFAEETRQALRGVSKTETGRHVVPVRLLHDSGREALAELAYLGRDGRKVEHVQRGSKVVVTQADVQG